MPPSKGLSVIIAGSTGSTGSELVSRLVSHKDVTRVVALSRSDISVDRWSSFFPGLRTTDALKYLSVVAVDWQHVTGDSKSIPAAVLCTNPSVAEADSVLHLQGEAVVCSSDRASDSWLQKKKSSVINDRMTLPQRFAVQAILQDPFYRSVFSGHHIAINCMGSHHLWHGRTQLNTVDHEYAIAFAKMVRLFSGVEITDTFLQDSTAEGKDVLGLSPGVDRSARLRISRDSPEWDEIRCACFGVSKEHDDDLLRRWDNAINKTLRGKRHTNHTLQQFIQISTAGAHEKSPLPYFSIHGLCDRRLLALFNFSDQISNLDDGAPVSQPSLPSNQLLTHRLTALPPSGSASSVTHSCDVTIFRPSLLKRHNARFLERMLAFFFPPIPVSSFADIIVDDIMDKQRVNGESQTATDCSACSSRCGSKGFLVTAYDIARRSQRMELLKGRVQ